MKRYLQPGYKFSLNGIDGYFEIKDIIGCGSSCVVYSADFTDKNGICTEHLLKEYNPKTLDIARDESGAIFVDNSDDIDAFEKGLVNFEKGYNIQLEIRRNLETKNTTANIQGIHEGNGTKYIDMTVFNGQTYDKIQENTLFDLLERAKAIAKVIREYHKKGFLHLDIKPNNVLALPEVKDLVMFFDFDSLLTKGEILSGGSVSYTKSWAAPELLLPGRRSKLCEATDIFSIGEIMFYQIFGRHSSPEERRSFANYEFEPDAEIFKDADQSIFKLLSELFSRTICGVISKRYASADELIEMLDKLLPLANPKRTRIISTLPSVQSFFVGRETEIEEIHGKLQDNDLLFVSGMGGIGKSELVKNYANRYKDSYDAIIFAPYVTDFVMLITDDKSVSVANVEILQGEQITEYYKRKLTKLQELCNERTLFIIDNYDTQEDPNFRDIQSLNCKKIITTRFDFADFNVSQIEIGTISARSDVNRIFNEYYGKSLSEEDKITVDRIIDLVDCHTMTVELLAKQMKSGRVAPQKMLEVLTKGGLGESGKEKINAAKDSKFVRQSAYDHIRALFDISGLEENELYVLGNLSLIPHSGILTEQFKVWCELESYEEINSLENEGWIRRNEEDDIISLHPVVSDIAFELVKSSSVDIHLFLIGFKCYLDNKSFSTLNSSERYYYIKLKNSISYGLLKSKLGTIDVAAFLGMDPVGYEYEQLELLIDFLNRSIDIGKSIEEYPAENIADAYANLSYLYIEKYDLDKALISTNEASKIYESIFGAEWEDVNIQKAATIHNNCGVIYHSKGSFNEAKDEYNYALKILSSHNMISNELFAEINNNLGDLYCDMDIFSEAEIQYNIAKKIITDILGEYSSETASIYASKGNLYEVVGEYNKAQNMYEHSLEIRQKLFGQENAEIAQSYISLGLINIRLKDYKKAEEYLNHSLSIRLSLYGKSSISVANCYSNLGGLYDEIGNITKAEECYLESIKIREKIDVEPSALALSYCNLGAFYIEQSVFDKAEDYIVKSLQIREKVLGKEHRETAHAYYWLGKLYNEKGNLTDARINLLMALNIQEKVLGKDAFATQKTQALINEIDN